jgi:hypothetical protein
MINGKCERCGVILDTKTNRARWTDGFWSYLCKDCMALMQSSFRRYKREQKELKTGVGF